MGVPTLLHAQTPRRQAPTFVVTDTSVRQGQFQAVAISRDTIVSSYPRAARLNGVQGVARSNPAVPITQVIE